MRSLECGAGNANPCRKVNHENRKAGKRETPLILIFSSGPVFPIDPCLFPVSEFHIRTRKSRTAIRRPAFRCQHQTKTELCATRLIFFGLHAFPCEGLHGMSSLSKERRVSRRPIQTTLR